MKFEITGTHTEVPESGSVTVRFEAEGLDEVLRGIELFLRGCGFVVDYEDLRVRDDP